MTALVGDIMEDALDLIGEIAGPGTNAYSEDRIRKEVVRSFNMLFKKYHWPQYCDWFRVQLDGLTGTVTTNDLSAIVDAEDVVGVKFDGRNSDIPRLPIQRNPFAINTSGAVSYWRNLNVNNAYYATKRLIFYPITATDFVNVGARLYPTQVGNQWVDDDTMYLDKDLLVFGAAFSTMSADDVNANAAKVAQQMMDIRYKDIISSFADTPMSNTGGVNIPNSWSMR